MTDGDTMTVAAGKRTFRCRLYGIDAPEKAHRKRPGQPFAEAATVALENLVKDKELTVYLTGETTYGREVCVVKVDGRDVNRAMLLGGYAWAYRKHLREPLKGDYIAAEEEARRAGRGLWAGEDPMFPGRFKHLYW